MGISRLTGSGRNKVALPIAGLSLVIAVFAIASVHRWAIVLGAGLALLSTIPFIGSRRYFAKPPPLLLFLGVCTLLTGLQVLPLPSTLVHWLSPSKYELVVDNAAALKVPAPGFFSLSLDPNATLRELGKLIGYFAFAFTCLRLVAKEGSRNAAVIAQGVALIGALVALSALGHRAVHATAVFGLYTPEFIAAPVFLSPLLNANHLAGLMALSASLAIGLGFYYRGQRRALYVVVALLCSSVGVLSGSRGGAIALALGASAAIGMCLLQRRSSSRTGQEEQRKSHSLPVPQIVVGLCVFVLLAIATGGGLLEEFRASDRSELSDRSGKIELWRSARPLIARHPLTGIGRGAFEQAMPKVRPSSQFSYASLENEYLQAVVDWGLIGALAAAAALLLLGASALRRWNVSGIEAGALAGVSALALQNIVDFSLSLPGVVYPVIALLAVLSRRSLSVTKATPLRKGKHAGLVVAGAALLAILSLPSRGMARNEKCSSACSSEEAAKIWDRHPADYSIAGKVALALRREKDGRAIAVLNRALMANPSQWGLHLLAARWLQQGNAKRQSLFEYSLSLQVAPASKVAALVAELTTRYPDASDAIAGLPTSPDIAPRIVSLLRAKKSTKLRHLYVVQLTKTPTPDRDLLELVIREALKLEDTSLALKTATSLFRHWPDGRSALNLARAEFAHDNSPRGLEIVAQALAEPENTGALRMQLLQLQAKILIAEGKFKEARVVLNQALHVPSAGNKGKASVHLLLAEVEDRLGNHNQADLARKEAESLQVKGR